MRWKDSPQRHKDKGEKGEIDPQMTQMTTDEIP
jgi:hypothetical protein